MRDARVRDYGVQTMLSLKFVPSVVVRYFAAQKMRWHRRAWKLNILEPCYVGSSILYDVSMRAMLRTRLDDDTMAGFHDYETF